MDTKKETVLREEWDIIGNSCTFDEALKRPKDNYLWKCSRGHNWTAKLVSRKKPNSKCPYCAGRRAITGENDVATLYPNLKAEFHPTKNGNRKLENYKENSPLKVWWICAKKHEWEAVINTRTKRKYGCPVCSDQKIVPGVNDFASLYPDLAKEVAEGENEGIDITHLGGKSHKKLVWKCSKGHKYKMPIEKRTVRQDGCPYCFGRYAIAGENDLETLNPEVAIYWDSERNGSMKDYKPGSHKDVSWKCENGHFWKNKVYNQVKNNVCPYCSGKEFVVGQNDVATVYPSLALEWDSERNKTSPSNVKASTSLKVHWRCRKNHSWRATIYNRLKGKNCPYCAGKMPIKGENDLATRYPFLKDEWDYSLNRKGPEDFLSKSNTKVWWVCREGHHYKTRISDKTRGAQCPECRKKLFVEEED